MNEQNIPSNIKAAIYLIAAAIRRIQKKTDRCHSLDKVKHGNLALIVTWESNMNPMPPVFSAGMTSIDHSVGRTP